MYSYKEAKHLLPHGHEQSRSTVILLCNLDLKFFQHFSICRDFWYWIPSSNISAGIIKFC